MKKLIVLCICLMFLIPNTKSQTRNYGVDNFRQIQQSFYQNYTGIENDSSQGWQLKQFKRWETFWGPRLTYYNSFDSAYIYNQKLIKDFNFTETESQIVQSDWVEIGPAENGLGGIGRIDAIAFHPTDTSTIYVGCPSGGVWVSYNKGQTWQNLNTDHQLPSLGISSIAIDPVDPNNIFLGTGDVDSEWVYSSGIYRSINAGQTWECIGLCDVDEHFTISKIIIHPSDANIAFVSTSKGIFKTNNRNANSPNWTKVYPALTGDFEYVRNIAFHPNQPSVLYAVGIDIIASNQSGNLGTWHSIADGNGLDFTNTPWPDQFGGVEYVDVMNMAIGPNGDVIYVNCLTRDNPPPYNWNSPSHNYAFKYYINSDQWEIMPQLPDLALTPGRNPIVVSPLDSKYVYQGGVNLYVFLPDIPYQPDRWVTGFFNSHVDFHELVFSPHEPNVLYAGTDGGLYSKELYSVYPPPSGDATELNEGLGISTIYNFGSSLLDPYQILSGYQDCGISYFKDDVWTHIFTSDGFQCLMDKHDINIMYHTTYAPTNGTLRRSVNDCLNPTFEEIMSSFSPINETSWFGASLVSLPNNPKALIQARLNLWKVDDATTATVYDWYKITDVNMLTANYFGENNCVSYALEVAPNNPEYIYFTGVKIDSWTTDFDANRIFKTSTGGGTDPADWTDITPPTPGNALGTYFISDIAVSSWNPNKIWICYSGYMEDYKIKHYNGNSWVDYNEGLPNIPTNCITYVNGSNDALFLGTDIGVYYRDGSMTAWEPFMHNLPNVIVNWLELNYTNQMLRAGTFGRGLWESFIPSCSKNTDTVMTINSNVIWLEPHIVTHDLTIESGSVLTVKSTVSFAEDCKLIVKENGKLILDGGIITNACGDLWQGIEVWGDPLAAQHTTLYHGMVHIKNGGKIENAVIGVRAGSSDTPGKGGGIIMATDAEFVNNGICVMYDPYAFTNTGYFGNCTFARTGNLLGQGDQGVFTLVKLNNVDDVTFSNCHFINETVFDYVGSGIESFNSIFRVLGRCIDYAEDENYCVEWDYGSFTNLEYGIYATAANATDFAYIKHTDFMDNYKGVYLSGMTGALVMDCNFEINTPFVTDGGYGLYLDNCTGYTIEENKFKHNGASRTGVGLIANNSGGAPNEIYRNWFTGLQQGVSAQELNRNFMAFPPQGLQILCCEFEDCDADILVPRSSHLTRWGIAPSQGANSQNPMDMAGNLFDIHSQTPDGDFDDIFNEGAHLTYYYPLNFQYGLDNLIPVDYTQSTVTLFPVNNPLVVWKYSTGCPPTQTGGGGGSESEMSESLMETRQMIDSTEQVYAMLVDGGSTESLYNEVYNSASPQTMQLYNELMGKSPYLSDTVVGATIEKEDVIPGAMLRDIMVANPHTAKSDNLLEKVDSRFDPLPDYMKAQILAGRSLVSLKEEMESNLARYRLQKSRLINGLIHHYLKADMSGGNDSVINLLQSDSEMASKYRLAMKHIETGNTTQALSVLNALPAQYNLHGQQLTVHQEMIDFCILTIQISTQAGGWQQATEAQVQQLYTLLQSATPASAYARNALLMLGELSYVEPVIVPDLLKSAQTETAYKDLMKSKAPPMLEVHPNPAKDFVIVGWTLDREQADGSIAIRRITGELKSSFTLSTPADKQTVDTRGWPSGAYVITLTIDGKVMESAKFTLVK